MHLLFSSTLPPRLRELAILRVAHRTDSEYEWGQHVKIGLREGLTEDEIAGVRAARPITKPPTSSTARF